jgi:hypothetical protein
VGGDDIRDQVRSPVEIAKRNLPSIVPERVDVALLLRREAENRRNPLAPRDDLVAGLAR